MQVGSLKGLAWQQPMSETTQAPDLTVPAPPKVGWWGTSPGIKLSPPLDHLLPGQKSANAVSHLKRVSGLDSGDLASSVCMHDCP